MLNYLKKNISGWNTIRNKYKIRTYTKQPLELDMDTKFVAIPFKLTNTPTMFICLMNSVFSKYLNKFVIVFIHDILVYSKDEVEHKQHLKIVLQTLKEHQLYAKLSKCDFYKKTNTIFGAHNFRGMYGWGPKQDQNHNDWPIPKDVHNI